MATEVGRVVGIWRYPVKSMAGEALDTADVSWNGVAGDRRWAFVRPGVERSGFPWLTIRERPDLVHFAPEFADPTQPDTSLTLVTTPDGDVFDVTDPALAAHLGEGVRVIKQDRGVFDAFPLSLLTVQTVTSLGETVGADLDARRFRPTLLVDAPGGGAFPEDAWVGRTLRLGGLAMRVDKRDKRCAVVNVDPTTGARDPAVLRAVAQTHDACLGVYGSTVQPGRVTVGDVALLMDEASTP